MTVELLCAGAAVAALLICAVRMFIGPSLADRTVAATAASLCIAVCGAALAGWQRQSLWLDFAMLALLVAAVLGCLWLKVFAFGSMQPPMAEPLPERRA